MGGETTEHFVEGDQPHKVSNHRSKHNHWALVRVETVSKVYETERGPHSESLVIPPSLTLFAFKIVFNGGDGRPYSAVRI